MDLTNGHANAPTVRVRRIPNFRLRCDPKRLAAAALEQFSATGYAETRVEDVARRLGLSKSAVYMHFPTKRALFDRVIEDYCLPDQLTAPYSSEVLKHALASEPARSILHIVLREWPCIPGLGNQYFDAIVARLVSHPAIETREEARSLATSALAPVMMSIFFLTDPASCAVGI